MEKTMNGIPEWMIAVSVWLCKMLGGPKGYSLCAWFWEMSLEGHPWGKPLASVADSAIFWEKQHCRRSWYLRRGYEPPTVSGR